METSGNRASRVAKWFIHNFRISIILFVGIIFAGFITYETLLPREGLPSVQFPFAYIQTPYPVNDIQKVDVDVTQKIENILEDIEAVKDYSSTTGPNFSVVSITFESEFTSEQGVDIVNSEFKDKLNLPQGINPITTPIKAGSIDNKTDLLLSLTSKSNKSAEELQEKANEILASFSNLSEVKETFDFPLINTVTNPITGETTQAQTSFNRAALKDGEALKFYNSILFGVSKKTNISTVELSEAINNKIASLKESGELTDFEIITVSDFAKDLKVQIKSLEESAIQAIVIVLMSLFIFVSWRASLVTIIFIPLTLAGTLMVMFLLGISINVISLFALILVLGLFVDDAIVVVEAIEYQKRIEKVKGLKAVTNAMQKVSAADISGTLTTLIVFVPMLAISGILGDFINQVPKVVITALAVSLVFALTLIPLLSHVIFPDHEAPKKGKEKRTLLDKALNFTSDQIIILGGKVSKLIELYLRKWYYSLAVAVISIVLILIGMSFAVKLKQSIFPPQSDSNGLTISMVFDESLKLEQRIEEAKKVENILVDKYLNEIVDITYFDVGRDRSGMNSANIKVDLTDYKDREISSVAIAKDLSLLYSKFESTKILVVEDQTAGGANSDYSYFTNIYGDDYQKLKSAATYMQEFISKQNLKSDVKILDVAVSSDDAILKENGRRYIQISAKLSDPQNDGAVAEIEQKVLKEFSKDKLLSLGLEKDAIDANAGFSSELFGSLKSAQFALIVALLIMYILLVFQFNSFTQPVLILTAIPFGFIGLFAGLYITDNAFSFFVQVGIIALVGIIVNNTIMLVDYINQNLTAGRTLKDSITDAVRIRFRPILTTTATTIAGLIPLMADPLWRSLTLTIIFGLLSSTISLILIFPAYFNLMQKLRIRSKKFIKKIVKF